VRLADIGCGHVQITYRGLGLKPTGRGFGFDFEAGGADDGGVLDGFSEEDEVDGTLVGRHGLCRGVVNGN
jgi:hypothetical protein